MSMPSAPAVAVTPVGSSLVTRSLLVLVRLYQAARAGRPSPCRYDPSCSAYAVTALERFGAGRGTWLAARRLSRCHPWGRFGPDPVPDRAQPAPAVVSPRPQRPRRPPS